MTRIPQTAYSLAIEGGGIKVAVDEGIPVSPALMLDALRQVLRLPADMAARVCWDLRAGAANPLLDTDAALQIAGYLSDRLADFPAKPRMAFLVDRERSIDLARRVAFMAEALPLPAALFRTEADAWHWLALDEDRR